MTGAPTQPPKKMPSIGRLLLSQVVYQARLLAGGRTITIGVGFPVILLLASHTKNSGQGISSIATYSVFGLTLTAWNTYGVRLVAAREAGVLKRWRATPLPRWCYFMGRIIATVVVALAAGAVTVLVGKEIFGTHLTFGGSIAAIVAFVLGAFTFASVATALTALIPTLEAAAPTLMLTYFPLVIISGVFGSISEPHWLSTLASYLPAKPLADAVTVALRHSAAKGFLPVRDVVVLAVWAVAGIGLAIATFKWEPHRPTKRREARKQYRVPEPVAAS